MRGQRVSCVSWVAIFIAVIAGCDVDEATSKKKSKTDDPPADDGATNYPASQACTVVPQASCPSTHTCQVVTIAGATMCESAGAIGFGGYCNNNTDCAPGLACAYRQCRPHCETAADCGGPAPSCLQMFFGDQVIEKFRVCSIPCSPIDPQNGGGAPELAACPSGWGCFPFGGDVLGSTDCFEAGTSPPGASCESGLECQPGLVCLTSGATSSCTQMCIMGLSGCNCAGFAQPQFVALGSGVYELGYCQ
jgi:hypothetical protein